MGRWESKKRDFWIHRVLQNEGIENHVYPVSIAISCRRRQAKTDRIGGGVHTIGPLLARSGAVI